MDEIFRTCPDRPWGPPNLLYNGYRVFSGKKRGRGVTLTPHPLLVPWSRKSRTIPLLPLWAVRPVQSLSACTRVHVLITIETQRGCHLKIVYGCNMCCGRAPFIKPTNLSYCGLRRNNLAGGFHLQGTSLARYSGGRFLWNVGTYLPNYTAPYVRRWGLNKSSVVS